MLRFSIKNNFTCQQFSHASKVKLMCFPQSWRKTDFDFGRFFRLVWGEFSTRKLFDFLSSFALFGFLQIGIVDIKKNVFGWMESVSRGKFYEISFNFLFSEFEFFYSGNEFRLAKTFWLDWKLFAPNFFLHSNFDFSIFAAFLLPRLPLRVCVCVMLEQSVIMTNGKLLLRVKAGIFPHKLW